MSVSHIRGATLPPFRDEGHLAFVGLDPDNTKDTGQPLPLKYL